MAVGGDGYIGYYLFSYNFMRKIKTIFKRDATRKVANEWDIDPSVLVGSVATEKLDGMNVRATIRYGECVRLEKRRNPDKIQKYKGIIEPWYTDTSDSSEDKWLKDAQLNTNFLLLPDGEWSGEAVGPNMQGNPLNLDYNRIVFFTLNQAPVFENVPVTFEELKVWLPIQKSKYGKNCGIEGIVWHCANGDMAKIKRKDF